jgi:hypothetical protein
LVRLKAERSAFNLKAITQARAAKTELSNRPNNRLQMQHRLKKGR